MARQITHIQFSGVDRTHDGIDAYKWRDDVTGAVDWHYRSVLVAWVDDKSNHAYVGSGTQRANVGVWRSGGNSWLQTYADGTWNNNLLSLPTFKV